MEVQDIFEDIVDADPEGDQDSYTVCIRKLDHHFRCEDNVPTVGAELIAKRLIGLLCVSVSRQGAVIAVNLSMTIYVIR